MIIQYPLKTTFPIGGDATQYILRLQEVKEEINEGNYFSAGAQLFTSTAYPGTQIILATSTLLPISWPDRFIWLIVLGHIATGAAIGYVTHKAAGRRAGSLSIAAWGIAGMAFTHNFIDGTLAQLLSLPALVLAIYSWSQRKFSSALLLLILTYFLHPLSAAVLVGTIIWALISEGAIRWQFFKRHPYYVLGLALVVLGSAYILFNLMLPIASSYPSSDEGFSFHDILANPVGPLVIIAPIGWLALQRKGGRTQVWFIAFSLVSLVLFWHFQPLQDSIFLKRFQPYFAVSIAMLAGIGIDYIWKRVFSKQAVLPSIIFSLLFIGLGLQTWEQNATVFNFFESRSRYERTHETELEAFGWAGQNLPPGSTIISTTANRHPEWIPILTHHSWVGLQEDNPVFKSDPDAIARVAVESRYSHAIFLKKQEKPEEVMPAIGSFETVYENDGAVIIKLLRP